MTEADKLQAAADIRAGISSLQTVAKTATSSPGSFWSHLLTILKALESALSVIVAGL